ncbi:uncharacterized protein LOC101453621 [Ceratitis capitata]|uniref:(Mediterranean fruit fly) hypothetical protein n=1 Tax=Ceratitis capitata TaxID=7213 RepID=W8BYL5_CERCA|nr:uncharacterized protein LOC101453621 [Ceratitis capitata]CAD7011593.1 unnamed protein product [Ceratitis capitata]
MLEDLHKLFEMHTAELEQVQENVANYLVKVQKVFEKIYKNKESLEVNDTVALMAYDKFFTILTNMLDMARKFNFHLFMNDLEKKSLRTLYEALDSCDQREKCTNEPKAFTESNVNLSTTTYMKSDQRNILKTLNEKESEKFSHNCNNDYNNSCIPRSEENDRNNNDDINQQISLNILRKDISKYKVGSILNGSVTYIRDLDSLSFFVCDSESIEFQKIANLKSMLHLKQYIDIPPKNEIFGLVLDDTILRAIRLNSSTNENHDVLLMDFGETTTMSAADVTYRLPIDIQKIPAQAMLCKLNGIFGQKNTQYADLRSYLQELEYTNTSFLIKFKEEKCSIMTLDLLKDNRKKEADLPENKTKTASTNLEKVDGTNPFQSNSNFAIDDNDEAIPLRALPLFTEDNKRLPNGLTQEEMDMLAEEPLNTTNAMTAVLGYNPKDEQRICRFYDPKTGCCFKGANCRLEHTPQQPDGWTKDRIPTRTIIESVTPMTRFAAGIMINITVTHVGEIEYFYAQINDIDNPIEPLIWNDDEIPFSIRLTKPPMLYDLVRAQYDDTLWYRAKIIDFDDSGKVFKVFYVDYGNQQNVTLLQLAHCDRLTEHFAFQAVQFRVADIMQNPEATVEQRSNGIRTINALILNHAVDVKVVNHDEDLIVRFMGAPYSSIPKRLISMGCAKQFHSNGSNSSKGNNSFSTTNCSV